MRGIKQGVIATELGITQSAYSSMEKGERQLILGQVERIAEILSVPMDCLLSSEDLILISGKDKVITQEIFDSITKAQQEHINDLKNDIVFLRNLVVELNKEKDILKDVVYKGGSVV